MKWRPYPAYKDSGIVWLDRIPTHWKTTHIKHLASSDYKSFIDGDWIESPYITDEGIRLVQTGNIGVGQYREQGYRYISEDTFNKLVCTEVMPGDVLICRLAAPVGRACVAPNLGVRMITSVDVCILKPQSNHNPRYIIYFLSSEAYLHWMASLSRGSTRDRISRSMLGDIEFVAPPLPEQRAIAAFLDRQTAHIDTLIAKKERQIELLQEKRAALISHAVTKGLDPTVPMKDSGVEWLGEIPAHWEVRRLRYLVQAMNAGPFGSSLTKNMYTSQGYRVYGQEQVIPADFSIGDYYISEAKYQTMKQYAVIPGDVLVSCVGTFGKVAVVPESIEPGIINPRLIKLTPIKSTIIPDYLGTFLKSDVAFEQMSQVSRGGTMGVINLTLLSDLQIVFPSLSEQQVIIGYLDRETTKLDTLIAKVQESIERLHEYRTALISAAVTGKIDVRYAEEQEATE